MKNNLCLLVLLALILLAACAQKGTQNKCDAKDMLLSKPDFPQGTFIDDTSSPVAEYPVASAGLTASFMNDLMYQIIGRYSSVKNAEKKYTENLRYYFGEDDFNVPWETPVELSYKSPLAQHYHVACGDLRQGFQCRMIGQYNDYYVFFFAYISDDGITLESFENLLTKIDDHMALCIRE